MADKVHSASRLRSSDCTKVTFLSCLGHISSDRALPDLKTCHLGYNISSRFFFLAILVVVFNILLNDQNDFPLLYCRFLLCYLREKKLSHQKCNASACMAHAQRKCKKKRLFFLWWCFSTFTCIQMIFSNSADLFCLMYFVVWPLASTIQANCNLTNRSKSHQNQSRQEPFLSRGRVSTLSMREDALKQFAQFYWYGLEGSTIGDYYNQEIVHDRILIFWLSCLIS